MDTLLPVRGVFIRIQKSVNTLEKKALMFGTKTENDITITCSVQVLKQI